jgi:hypothetical protein
LKIRHSRTLHYIHFSVQLCIYIHLSLASLRAGCNPFLVLVHSHPFLSLELGTSPL